MIEQLPEAFLQYIWKTKLFYTHQLFTTQKIPITLLNIGIHNHQTGPDFLHAKIKIGEALWMGHVEIHRKASDWLAHQHQHDKNYDLVILHVVYENDIEIKRTNHTPIPTLCLKGKIPKNVIQNYWRLYNNQHWIPCQEQILSDRVTQFRYQAWLDRLVVERLEYKTHSIQQSLNENKNDWEQSFYKSLARSLGAKVNANAFERLADSLPLKILQKHSDQLCQLEALLLGQAGLLDKNFKEEYPKKLQKEYRHLQKKYKLQKLLSTSWQFGKIRPAAYPTIRMAQLALLLQQEKGLFSKIINCKTIKQFQELFKVQLLGYWKTHYRLDECSKERSKSLGRACLQTILINSIVPFLFVYGKRMDDESYKDLALKLLESIPSEKNSILNRWNQLGFSAPSAYTSQALLELKNSYCNQKRCTECAIGNRLIRKKISLVRS